MTIVQQDLEGCSVGLVCSDRPLVVNNQPSKLELELIFQFFTHVDHHRTMPIRRPSTSHLPSLPSIICVGVA